MALLKSILVSKYLTPIIANSCRTLKVVRAKKYYFGADVQWREQLRGSPNSNRSLKTKKFYFGADVQWREERSLPKNPNAEGPLTDLPDYTFMSGDRPTPLGSNQKKRIIAQRAMAHRMITLINEMDDAKVIHQRSQAQKQKIREDTIANKLKPKGNLLLKKT